jgi:DnaJ-like protein
METVDNYYAILGVPIDADNDTLKRAYRQLARRYHPDLAGPEGAVQMKRINRAYDVLSDPEKRLNYDMIIGGVIDLRKGGMTRPRPVQRKFDLSEDIEFSGLSIFGTKGPLHPGPVLHTGSDVISSLSSVQTERGVCIAAGSLDGKVLVWHAESNQSPISFATDPALTTESLRELRFSPSGGLLAGWGRLGLHVWDLKNNGRLPHPFPLDAVEREQEGEVTNADVLDKSALYAEPSGETQGEGSSPHSTSPPPLHIVWSYSLTQRAVSAHYSLDVVPKEAANEAHEVWMALPLLRVDPGAPRALGVRGTDVVKHVIGTPVDSLSEPLVCAEEEIEKRQFWAIRLRALAQDARTLLTLSCAHVPGEQNEMVIMRRWDLYAPARRRFGGKTQPQISTSWLAGLCADCAPPYTVTPDTRALAFVYSGKKIRLYDTVSGTYSELNSGPMGASSRLAISPNAQWVAVAREDSEANEGVIDLWSAGEGQIVQKLYHPWQISALHFAGKQLIVALTDGTIQVWK